MLSCSALSPPSRTTTALASKEIPNCPHQGIREGTSHLSYYIFLLKVLRNIRQWVSELDNGDSSQAEDNSCFSDGDNVSSQSDICNGDKGHSCMVDTVCLLISISSLENSFMRHSTGKIFVAVFEFIAQSRSSCEEYLRCLWLSLNALISSVFPPFLLPKTQNSSDIHLMIAKQFGKAEEGQLSEGRSYDHACFISSAIQRSLDRPSYSVVAHIAEVIFNILKIAKVDYSRLLEMNIHLSISAFSNFGWESLNGKIGTSKPAWLFFGALVRILCSLTDLKDLQEETSALDEISTYSKFTSLVHRILSCCFSHHYENRDITISHYLKHKSLMLITRLSFGTRWRCSFALLWLDFLKQFYEDLLLQPISKCYSGHKGFLEGSPFQVPGHNVSVPCICHLQRQVHFLFLKCCVTLASPSNSSDLASCYATSNVSVPCEAPVSDQKCYEKGLNELYLWIRRQSSLTKYVGLRFSLSVLQLYMDEDDMLFEVLLLLLDYSLLSIHEQKNEISGLYLVADQDIVSYIFSVFNPIHLFHLFLLMLQYDHSVLLDHLISKDVGIRCLQYLLRCLRIVCRSWSIFTEFNVNKTLQENCYSTDTIGCLSEERLGCFTLRHGDPHCKRQRIENDGFENAKQCLLSLKSSIHDLHQKKLFPYNPHALLKSFSKFEELCRINVNDVR